MLIVNYFPGSMGDTVISQLSGLPFIKDNLNRTIIDYPDELKQVEFYDGSTSDQTLVYKQHLADALHDKGILGAHRFKQFDFKSLDHRIKVVSIDPTTVLQQVVEWYTEKVFAVYTHNNNTINKILEKNDHKLNAIRFKYDIEYWIKTNILKSDIIFDLGQYIANPEYINEFKVYYNKSN